MGQVVLGVFYGAEEPRNAAALRGKWEALPARKRGKPNLSRTYHGDVPLIGFWVALCGDVDEAPGAVDISGETLRIDKVAELPSAAAAHLAWERFSAWGAGVITPPLPVPLSKDPTP